jgi:hypothetical protein
MNTVLTEPGHNVYGAVFLHDNVRPHMGNATCTQALLEHFNWELFDHPPYSPDLSAREYNLFTYPKNWLRSCSFNNNEELMESVKTWLSSQAAHVFDTGIHKLILQYDKCLYFVGDYVEKYLEYVFFYT